MQICKLRTNIQSMKPLILIANDDSIAAKGIRVLTEIMAEMGEVVLIAPDTHQSGMGHAITDRKSVV